DETRVASERLEAVIDSAPVAILEVGLDDCVKGWNSAAERIFGWCAADVLGRPVPIVPPEYEQEFRELLQRIRAGHAYAGYETVRRRRDGSLVDVAISAAPIRDAGGAVIGHMAMFGDITERKQRELELRRESEFLRTTADTIESLLAVVDEDGEVVGHAVNKAFERRIGWSEDEMRGTSFLELFAPADRPGVLATIRAAAAGATVPERESRWQNRWGGHADVAWTATAVTDPAGRRQVLVSGTDVTERKRQEEEVRDSRRRLVQAADEARRELERDLHDGAQQRLVALSLSLRLAEAKLASDPDEAGRILGRAREELTHALEELRELARGIHPAVLTERGLNAALEALVTRAPLPVQLELADDRLPPPVEAAAYFVISEALTNVAKYAQATSAHVRVRAFNGLATVEVSDDGVGGADPAAGSGLRGLADRVAALDGTLQVESTGAGTRVVALLPVRAPAHAV
ncbi:MAG TPA: PAS domain S-box protein, partial [Gaiellaceae bacterium]|nr:PAS domain S-box protein [Gaiellaceae bacterium]